MRGDGGLILPLLVEEQPRRILTIGMDMMRDATGFGARSSTMFGAQGDDFFALGSRNGEGSGYYDHSFSVARVVLFDMK